VFNTDGKPIRRQATSANLGGKFQRTPAAMHGYSHSLDLCLPPLSVLCVRRDAERSEVPCVTKPPEWRSNWSG